MKDNEEEPMPSLYEMEEALKRMADGPRKTELRERLAELRSAKATHDLVTGTINDKMKDQQG